MIAAAATRLRATRTALARLTLVPVLLRCGIGVSALASFALAYPVQVLTGRAAVPLLALAVLPALSPRRVWPTGAVLVAVAGWIVATSGYDRPVELWRLSALATVLYLTHSLCALAAVLPTDGVVAPDLLVGWLWRALAVPAVSALLGVLLLTVAERGAGPTTPVALFVGLAVAVGVAALLARSLRR